MKPLDPKVYDALLEVYHDKDYDLMIDYRTLTSTFILKEVVQRGQFKLKKN